MSRASGPDAAALERVLRDEGFACRVEARDRLAILIPDHTSDASAPETGAPNAPNTPDTAAALVLRVARERALGLARAHGFTHVALELPPAPTLAPSPGAGLPRP